MAEPKGASSPEKNAPTRFQENMNRAVQALGTSGVSAAAGMAPILLAGLAAALVLVFLLSKTPGRTLHWFFLGPFRNLQYFGNMINSSIPLVFGGLGVSVAMQAGSYNLGGEGQLYAGAFVAAAAASFFAPLGPAGAAAALLLGGIASGLMAAFSGFCRARWNTAELISSFLVSNMAILAVNWLITGPFLDPGTNLQSTRKIPLSFRLPRLLPASFLNVSFFAALIAAVLVWLFLYRSRPGYEIRMTGHNPIFARYGGIHEGAVRILAMFLSGVLYGLGGGFAVYGTYYAAVKEFSAGLGWNGLAVALIARTKPALVFPAALFFAWVGSGARLAMQFSDVTQEIASIVQAVVFFLVTGTVAGRALGGKK